MNRRRQLDSTSSAQIVRITAGIALFSILTGCGSGTGHPDNSTDPPINQAPTAVLNVPSSGVTGQVLTFSDAGSSDPDDDPLTYAWTFGDGGIASGVTTTHAYTAVGIFTVTLTVSDPSGATASATATATISSAPGSNALPVITSMIMPTPSTVIAGQSIEVSATASDSDTDPLIYSWNFGDGPSSTPPNASPDATHTYSTAGSYVVTLTVSDGRGSPVSDTRNIAVTPPLDNQPPIADVGGPYAGLVGEALSLSAIGSSDPEGGDLTYDWDFGDETTGTGVSPTHAYNSAATYFVTVTVKDPAGASHSETTTATISSPIPGNAAPAISVTIPAQGLVLQNLILRGTASDPDGDTLTYSWNFGDGTNTAFGPNPSVVHEYSEAGTYVATLTVSDGQGHSVSANGTVTVTLPTRPVAFAQSLLTLRRTDNIAAYIYRIAIELDGSGVPPLRFNIHSYPTHWSSDAQTLNVAVGNVYQWWNPIATPPQWRPECLTTYSLPASCRASFSSQVDVTTGAITMTPSTVPPTVSYLPERCWIWFDRADSFSFTVTDGNGVTSDPAVVAITLRNLACHPPTF